MAVWSAFCANFYYKLDEKFFIKANSPDIYINFRRYLTNVAVCATERFKKVKAHTLCDVTYQLFFYSPVILFSLIAVWKKKLLKLRTRHYAIQVWIFRAFARKWPMLAKLISIFFCSEIQRILLGGEHKLSVSFTKVNIVNLFLTQHVLCITDVYFILSWISMLEIGLELMLGYYFSTDSSLDERSTGVVCSY